MVLWCEMCALRNHSSVNLEYEVTMSNKRKIINDPVFGFITVPNDFIYDLVQHPYLQRLNRIRQLGLSSFVYPGAVHTRFLHSLGAMHLMGEAIRQLRFQGQEITPEEAEAAQVAILLHDIGHGPFSHVLEHAFMTDVHHEQMSLMLMERMNEEFGGRLDMAISIFKNEYPKHFLHQLVSGQLDMDRLDYLCRDSFFAGVNEGTVASSRIIKMLNVKDDQLVVDVKGIYSIEKFLVARRLMYWQVYLHKTSVAAEQMLINILRRAKELVGLGRELFASEALLYFLRNNVTLADFRSDSAVLDTFVSLDDNDVYTSIKAWAKCDDVVLSTLCAHFVDRRLFKTKYLTVPLSESEQQDYAEQYSQHFGIQIADVKYFYGVNTLSTDTYSPKDDRINILYKTGEVLDISEASDMLNLQVLTRKVNKHLFYYLKILEV